jgi:hypothetical protein
MLGVILMAFGKWQALVATVNEKKECVKELIR